MPLTSPLSARFRPSAVILDGAPAESQLRLRVDGAGVAAQPAADPEGLRIPPPASVRDGRPHAVEVTLSLGGETQHLAGVVQSSYVGHLDRLDGGIAGWIYDAAEPERPVLLDLEVDGTVVLQLRAETPRADVPGPAARPGFHAALPPPASFTRPRLLTLRVAGTGLAPLGSVLLGVTAASYAAALSPGAGGTLGLLRDRVALPGLLGAVRGQARPEAPPKGGVALSGPGLRRSGAPVVDVVIPAYRGLEATRRCIESVLAGRGTIAENLVVVNDASPEPELTAWLRAQAAAGRLTCIENERNRGFVASANIGMRRNPDRDVVLLNADTEVPPGWVDRLRAAAHGEERIATVTALSNNATVFSLPRIEGSPELPYGATLAEIDAVCRDANAGLVVDVPTAHGFCMFIRRDAIEDVGLFDEEAFGRGYGEENDFSLRAAARGWRNLAACDVFVWHEGSVSFGAEVSALKRENGARLDARYPDYHRQVMEFIRTDPLHAARNRVQMAFWRDRRAVALVCPATTGGSIRAAEEMAAAFAEAGRLVLVLEAGAAGSGFACRIRAADGSGELRYPPGESALARAFSDLLALGAEQVVIHHLLDLEREAAGMIARLGLPYRVVLHDFFYLCPRVTLLDEATSFCGLPAVENCQRCVARGGVHVLLHPSQAAAAQDVAAWRERWGAFLAGADRVTAPSETTAALYRRIFPGLPISVHAHEAMTGPGAGPPARAAVPEAAPGQVRVAMLGAIGPHKGAERLFELVRHAERWAPDLHFVVLGYTALDARLRGFPNVTLTGPYTPATLTERLAAADAQVALFLSVCPETYSYTLSEALAHGLTPVALDLGAIGERLRALGHGVLRPLHASPTELVEAIRAAATMSTPSLGFTPDPPVAPDPPPPAPRGAIIPLLWRGWEDDGWLAREAEWLLHLTAPLEGGVLQLFAPPRFAGQFATVTVGGLRIARVSLRPGAVTPVPLPPQPRPGLLHIACQFDFDQRLPEPDRRSMAARLRALELRVGGAAVTWRLPQDLPPVAAAAIAAS